MVTQETQDFIFTVVDANLEYDTKFVFFCLFFIYIIACLWWANRVIPFGSTRDQAGKFPIYVQILVKLTRVGGILFLFYLPLMYLIFMYRGYDIDSLVVLVVTGYSVVTMIGLGIWFLFGMHWVQELLELVGIDTGRRSGTIIRRRDRN